MDLKDKTFQLVLDELKLLRGDCSKGNRLDVLTERLAKLHRTRINSFQQNEMLFSSSFEQAAVGIVYAALDGTFYKVNQRFSDMLGYTRDELQQMKVPDITHPDDISTDLKYIREVIRQKKNSVTREKRYIRKDGSVIWGRLTISVVKGAAGESKYLIAVIEDISSHKKVEKRFFEIEERNRALVSAMPDQMFRLTPDGVLLDFKAPENEITLPSGQLIGGNLLDTDMSGEVKNQLLKLFDEAVKSGEIQFYEFDRELHGELQTYEARIVKSGQAEVVCILRNITERRAVERKNRELEARLHQAQKMEAIGTLAGGIAHDFNNILTAVLGYTELAEMELPDGIPGKNHIKGILEASYRAKELVQQILNFSRQSELNLSPIMIKPIVKEALNLLRATLPSSIHFRIDINNECGQVNADPVQIHQILMNLCANASYAMKNSNGVLDVSLKPVQLSLEFAEKHPLLSAGPYVKLTVKDNGPGMETNVLNRIFEPYFTTKDKGEGTGLGLSVVHGIVKRHNGEIIVTSEPGQGTTFEVYLPAITVSTSVEDRNTPSKLRMGNERILLIDDEQIVVDMSKTMIEKFGYTVTAFTDSTDALRRFQNEPGLFDLVITDMTMPEMTGDILAKNLMKLRPDIPVILCSGYTDLITDDEVKEMGIKAYLAKPVSMRSLSSTIRQVLDRV